MGTNEKRCEDCSWEFYEAIKEEYEDENGDWIEGEVCPECGSPNFENKLMGKGIENENLRF